MYLFQGSYSLISFFISFFENARVLLGIKMCCLLFAMPDAQATLLCGGLHYKPLCRKVNAGLAWCHLMVTREVGISVFPWSKRKFNQVQLRLFFLHQCNRRIVCFRDLQQQWFFFLWGRRIKTYDESIFRTPCLWDCFGGKQRNGWGWRWWRCKTYTKGNHSLSSSTGESSARSL